MEKIEISVKDKLLAYPIDIYIKDLKEQYHIVFVPDFNIATQGETIPECICMARELIGNEILDFEEKGKKLPQPFSKAMGNMFEGEVLELLCETLVDVDIQEFKRKNSLKLVKKNCTLPSWLAYKAEEKGINFSKVLQEALVEKVSM